MEKVSIIVPVYNNVASIRQCLDSILNQTYPNIEIIIIDDGSNDGSEKICDEYARQYEKVKVVHKNNGGVSSARNLGLENATGSYIGFVDSDDYIENIMYQKLIEEIKDADLVMCSYYSGDIIVEGTRLKHKMDRAGTMTSIIVDDQYKGYLWNKLFKKSIIDHSQLRFNSSIHLGEDLLFCVQYIDKIEMAIAIPDPLYHYDDWPKRNAPGRSFNKKRFSIIGAYDEILEIDIIQNIKPVYREVKWKKIRHCLFLWQIIRKYKFEDKKQLDELIIKQIKKSDWKFLFSGKRECKNKILFILLKIFGRGYDD